MSKVKPRQYGTGSVFQRADGRWVARIEAGHNPDGSRRRIPITGKTEAIVKNRLKERLRDIARDGLPELDTHRTTVAAWATHWLPRHARDVSPKAYATDASLIRKWVVPTIGRKHLRALAPADLRAVHHAITDAGNSTTTARTAHWVMIGMLRAAILDGHPVPQRVLLTPAPPKAANDREAIPLPHALAILHVIAGRPDRARWVAALMNGMRQGECLGLTRDAIDLDQGSIDVSWQLQPLPYLDKTDHTKGFRIPDGYEARHLVHSYHLTRPKRGKRRIIPLVPWMSAALTEWLRVAPDNPWGLVWTATDNRYGRTRPAPVRAHADGDTWRAIQDQAKVRHPSGRHYTLHEARNTAATLLLEADIDAEVIRAILGHSSIVTTRSYQRVSQRLTREALEAVAGRLGLGG